MLSAAAVTRLLEVGRAHGLDAVGVAKAEPFDSTLANLEERKSAGLHGGMRFTYRNPRRSADPSLALPGASSLIVGARGYLQEMPSVGAAVSARSARYVWDDNYTLLREGLEAIADVLRRDGWRTRLLVDDNALVDREAAYRAGLGWYGKNSNLLLRGRGSWFVLGSLLTDAPLPPNEEFVEDGCGNCQRCIDDCPTGAIVAPGVVDARRCLAWLVQDTGMFPVEYREALGDRLYGCDDCQEVCPVNGLAERKDPPVAAAQESVWFDLLAL
ncbi:MAG: tRNA epoxyqueuosine(34) reductase QueG, partial [Acidimicrobiales bacterium]